MADPLFGELQVSAKVSGNKDYSEKIIGSLVNLASALGDMMIMSGATGAGVS